MPIRPLRRLSARGRRLDPHIHLLADKERKVAARKTEDHLEYAGIDAFGAVAGQGFFRQDERLEAHEGQRRFDFGSASEKAGGHRAGRNSVMIFISVDSISSGTPSICGVLNIASRMVGLKVASVVRPPSSQMEIR